MGTHLMSTLGMRSANDCGLAAAPPLEPDSSAVSSSSESSSPPAVAAATPLVGAGGLSPETWPTHKHLSRDTHRKIVLKICLCFLDY